MSNVTANQAPLIKAQVFSEFLLEQINDGFLPDSISRDVTDFGDGESLTIPVLGETTIRDYTEDTAVQYDALDSGTVGLVISEYVSAASYVTRKLQQDGYKAAALEASIPKEHLRLVRERWETDLLAVANQQTLADPNTVNGFDHRWVAGSGTTTGVLTLTDIAYAKLVFDKAYVPDEGRVLIVDPIVEASLNQEVGGQAFINNPQFEGIVNTGFAKSMRFVRNIYGFDIWCSNRLPRVASETIDGGPQASSTAITNGVVNIGMCILDDQHKPFMSAMRQNPVTDGEFNKDFQRDEYVTTARWGHGLQRAETLLAIIASETKFK